MRYFSALMLTLAAIAPRKNRYRKKARYSYGHQRRRISANLSRCRCAKMCRLCRIPATRISTAAMMSRTNGRRISSGRDWLNTTPNDTLANKCVTRLSTGFPKCPIVLVYCCCGRPKIGGLDYLYAISGAKIGLSINGDNNVRLYHSNRLDAISFRRRVLSSQKKFPDTDLLFKDSCTCGISKLPKNFLNWRIGILKHEDERKKIADAGMKWTHEQFNGVKIAGYILDLIENGSYKAPWTTG